MVCQGIHGGGLYKPSGVTRRNGRQQPAMQQRNLPYKWNAQRSEPPPPAARFACEFACETDSACDYNCLALHMRERGEGASRRHSVRLGLWRCSLERWQVLQCVVHTLDGGEVWQQIHLESVGIVHLMWNPPTGSGGTLVASVLSRPQ